MTKTTYRCFACGNDFETAIPRIAPYYCNTCIDRGAACEDVACHDTAETILREAERLTASDRHNDYGPYREEAINVSAGWNVLLDAHGGCDHTLVPLMMIWLKLVRQANRHKRDNLVDIAGYAHLAQQLNDKETPL